MPRAFKPRREESSREDRIANDIIVDAYSESERALSWYYYLQQRLRFPFTAKIHYVGADSPLRQGSIVQVIGLAKEDLCMSQIFVKVIIGHRSTPVPLWQLTAMADDEDTLQAASDWQYWMERGYCY